MRERNRAASERRRRTILFSAQVMARAYRSGAKRGQAAERLDGYCNFAARS
jgi:hypothetical protein